MKKSNNPLLYPLSWLYGLGVGLRNFLFNQGILKQQSYPIP
ncbi:MAG: tetraacyldisaccharide 4'-kinase, partial [Porphyromonas sp.]|nr:tetraacyldisaccharide 4'-kinase [Porphyromonas sp.]